MRFGTVFRPICCYLPLYRGHILWFDTVSGFEDTVSNHMFGFENTVSNHENNCCDLTLYSLEIQCQITLCSWNTVSNRIYVLRNTMSNRMISWEYSVKSHNFMRIQCQTTLLRIQCQITLFLWNTVSNRIRNTVSNRNSDGQIQCQIAFISCLYLLSIGNRRARRIPTGGLPVDQSRSIHPLHLHHLMWEGLATVGLSRSSLMNKHIII